MASSSGAQAPNLCCSPVTWAHPSLGIPASCAGPEHACNTFVKMLVKVVSDLGVHKGR